MSKKPVLTDEQTGEVIGGGLAKANPNATANPTVTDDASAGYAVGSVWLNASTGVSFNCTDATIGAAVWIAIGGGAADMEKATYDPTNVNGDAFARANHTGTQAAATISDFDTEVSNNPTVAANASFVAGDGASNTSFRTGDGASNTSHRTTVTGNPHAVSGDELNSDAQPAGKIIETDGSGGFVYLDTPSGGGSAAGVDRDVQFNSAGAFGALSSPEGLKIGANAGLSLYELDGTIGGTSLIKQGRGSITFGHFYKQNTSSEVIVGDTTAKGCLTFGATDAGYLYSGCQIKPYGNRGGALTGGMVRTGTSGGGGSQILTRGDGCMAFGATYNNTNNYNILIAGGDYPYGATGIQGCFALGYCRDVIMKSFGKGSFALGSTSGGGGYGGNSPITASGDGSFAFNGGATASAAGAVMFNQGTNNLAQSVKFGGAGYGGGSPHIRGGAQYGDPPGIADGQIWSTYNFYYGGHEMKVRVNGVTKLLSNIP